VLKVGAYLRWEHFEAASRLANIIVGRKGLQGINAAAYLENMAKSFFCTETRMLENNSIGQMSM
jgi:hypothetical protein